MVEKMKKMSLLMAGSDAREILTDLQELGVVHIDLNSVPDDMGISGLTEKIVALKKTSAILDSIDALPEPAEDPLYGVELVDLPDEANVLRHAVGEIMAEKALSEAEIDRCHKDLELWEPWGEFSPKIVKNLVSEGLSISFHLLPSKTFKESDFGNRHIEVISDGNTRVYFLELLMKNENPLGIEPLFPAERIPSIGIPSLKEKISEDEKTVGALENRLKILKTRKYLIEEQLTTLESERERLMAVLSLEAEAEGSISCLRGYVPLSLMDSLEAFLTKRSILPLFEDPLTPLDTPIRLKNRPVARLFEPITKIFGLPSYMEIDTTPFFAPFFAFFFGMCLADVGYGIIVTIGALIALLFLKGRAARSLAALGFILGLLTVVGGLFLNTFFGMEIDAFPNLPAGLESVLLFRNLNDAMAFSILLGVVQILFGFTMQVVNKWRQDGFQATLQPVGTFLFLAGLIMLGVAGSMGVDYSIGPIPVGRWLNVGGSGSRIGMAAASFGVLLILFFNNPAKTIWIRPLLGLWEMYGIVSGLLGDVLSYIRLFALALAGGLLGGAINLIAMMIRGDTPSILSWIFMLLVLVGGHFINFALAALGAFVHPLRLTFVEFYKAVGFVGGGRAYEPFGGKTS